MTFIRTIAGAALVHIVLWTPEASATEPLWRSNPVVPPPGAASIQGASGDVMFAGESQVIFVNFDGVTIESSGYQDDATLNRSWLTSGPMEPWGNNPAKRQAIMDAVRADWQAFNVAITESRPASGPYEMCVVSPTNFAGSLGIAPVDCNNSNPSNITYAFHSAGDSHPATTAATTIGQEVAHAFGLMHVSNPADVMNPFNAGGDASFRDECTAISGADYCPQQHQALTDCAVGTQNGYQELLAMFGARNPDTEPPTVSFVSPSAGENVPAGDTVVIEVTVQDNDAITEVIVYHNGDEQASSTVGPYQWDAAGLPAGEHTFGVEATDASGNVSALVERTITVQPASSPGGETAGGTGGADDAGDTDGALGEGTSDGFAGSGEDGDASAHAGGGNRLSEDGDDDFAQGVGQRGIALPSSDVGCQGRMGGSPLGSLWWMLLACVRRRRQSV